MSNSKWFGYGTMFVGIGIPFLWISSGMGIPLMAIGMVMLIRSHLMDREIKIPANTFPTAKEMISLSVAKSHSEIAELTLAKRQREQRVERIKRRIYSEQSRVEAELRAAKKPFVGLLIPPSHWNQFLLGEAPDEVAEAFRLREIEMQQMSGRFAGAARAR